jgi:hypothetical protein
VVNATATATAPAGKSRHAGSDQHDGGSRAYGDEDLPVPPLASNWRRRRGRNRLLSIQILGLQHRTPRRVIRPKAENVTPGSALLTLRYS